MKLNDRHFERRGWRRRLTAMVVMLAVCCTALLTPLALAEPEQIGGMTVAEFLDARVFYNTLDSIYTLPTWLFEEQPDVPYIALKDYVTLIFVESYDPNLDFDWDGDVMLITRNDMSVRVDTANQTVGCDDWNVFLGPSAKGALDNGIVEKEEFIAIRPSVKHESTRTPSEGFAVNVADYGIEMIRVDDDVLMPFAAAQAIFAGSISGGWLAFNGDDYFDIVHSVDCIYGKSDMSAGLNPYADMWYSGRFASRKELSEAYTNYNYAAMCMLLDLTYGHREEKGIQSFDSYLEENGLKEPLLTPDPKDDTDALETLFSVLFDSGHDAELLSPSILDSESIVAQAKKIQEFVSRIGYDSFGDLNKDLEPLILEVLKLLPEDVSKKLLGSQGEKGPNVTKLIAEMFRLTFLKPFAYGGGRVDIKGDTAIIYFDGFREDLTRSESYYTKLPGRKDMEESSFALFYYAFQKIEKDGNVKNVVIDLTDNGGGSAAALVATLGFLSEDGEVEITYRDMLNKNYTTEYYHVDTNLDGRFDDEDGYGGQYNFYVLTTGVSYSCGNAFPYFAQKANLAKIIGEKPGGGDCVVANYIDALGRVGAISGTKQLGRMEDSVFVSDESDVEVDIPISEEEGNEIFFHPAKIAEFIDAHAE